MAVCNCSIFCCTLLYIHSSIAIILIGKRELIALLNLSSWCLVMVERLFLTVPWGCLQFVIVVFADHTHLLFFIEKGSLLGRPQPMPQPLVILDKLLLLSPNTVLNIFSGPCLIAYSFQSAIHWIIFFIR